MSVLAAMAADRLGQPMAQMPATHRAALDAVAWPDLPAPVVVPYQAARRIAPECSTSQPQMHGDGCDGCDCRCHLPVTAALAGFNSQPDADIGWPPAGHEPPTAAEWHEPEGAQP